MATTRKHAAVKLPQNVALEPEQQKEFEDAVRQIKNRGARSGGDRGVIYLGHIPHGFFEPQMREFFTQFGKVTRLRLSRSKKTGHSRGYAFVEFASEEVAKIVADTMNNYLMFEKLLKCSFLPKEKLHPKMFVGSTRKFKRPKERLNAIDRHNAVRSKGKEKTLTKRMLGRQKKCFSKLAELGIDFTADDVTQKVSVKRNVARPVPVAVQTKDGRNSAILWEDSTEDEISFKTPPNVIKSSKLTRTTSGSLQIDSPNHEDMAVEPMKLPGSAGRKSKVAARTISQKQPKVKVGQKAKLKSSRQKLKGHK